MGKGSAEAATVGSRRPAIIQGPAIQVARPLARAGVQLIDHVDKRIRCLRHGGPQG